MMKTMKKIIMKSIKMIVRKKFLKTILNQSIKIELDYKKDKKNKLFLSEFKYFYIY